MKTTTFYNVTITIPGDDPAAAYAKLCEALADIGGDWVTDTYFHGPDDDMGEGEDRPTHELFPK